MDYSVKIVSSSADYTTFHDLPAKIYRNDSVWVAPFRQVLLETLNPDVNPYFHNGSIDLFIVYRSHTAVGRAAIIINYNHWDKFGEKAAFFGFFECMNDSEACKILFAHIIAYCRKKGAEIIEGPFNPNHYSEMGIQVSDFEKPQVFFETYNPPYYDRLLQDSHFAESYKIHTRINPAISPYLLERYGKIEFPKLAESNEFRIRTFNLFHFKRDLGKIREVYNDAFSDNWHFLPVSEKEYYFSAKYLFFVSKPSFVIFVERNQEPVGVLQIMLNVNSLLTDYHGHFSWWNYPGYLFRKKSIKEIVLYAVGIKKNFQGSEVQRLLFQALCAVCTNYKCDTLYTTWMSVDNTKAVKHAENLGLTTYKQFSMYKQTI